MTEARRAPVQEPTQKPTTEPHPKLRQVLARIREDARREPDRYLRDTEVPAGGE